MKNSINGFKVFTKGNALDLAFDVIIGVAFQGVVSFLTNNIISPIIGLFVGQNFDTLQIEVLSATITYNEFFPL